MLQTLRTLDCPCETADHEQRAHGNEYARGLWKGKSAMFEASTRGGKGAELGARRRNQDLPPEEVRRLPHTMEPPFGRSSVLAAEISLKGE